jgi:hypothetical protein
VVETPYLARSNVTIRIIMHLAQGHRSRSPERIAFFARKSGTEVL